MKDQLIKLNTYCDNLRIYHQNSKGVYYGQIENQEMINEAYSKSFENFEQAKKIFRTYFLVEVRRINAKNQKGKISPGYEKRCKNCKEVKTAGEFKILIDSRTGYTYLTSRCTQCISEEPLTEAQRESRRKYRATPGGKAKARARYERYKIRQKQLRS